MPAGLSTLTVRREAGYAPSLSPCLTCMRNGSVDGQTKLSCSYACRSPHSLLRGAQAFDVVTAAIFAALGSSQVFCR